MANKHEINYLVALPVVNVDFQSAREVLDAHLNKAKDTGAVYFSTSNRIDPKKLEKVTQVLLVSKLFTYIADLVGYDYFEDKSAPSDVVSYAPAIFAEDQDNHWLKLANIRPIGFDELNTFEMVNKKVQDKYNGVGNYVMNTGRLQVFYAKKTF
jgi:hypothetical protein